MAWKKKSKKGKKNDDELLTKLHTAETAFHVKKYLKRDMEPGKLNAEGDAPIHYYIKRKDKHRYDCLMAFLIHAKCELFIDLVNNDGMTALHLACQRNDFLCTKALIAFDADLNLINYDNCTPLDLVTGWYKSVSEIPRLLSDLGGIHAADVKTLQRQESDEYNHDMGYQENPNSVYFQDDPPEGEPAAHHTIRNRFGLDYQLMSIRKSMEDSLGAVPAIYFGGSEGLEFHDGREDVRETPESEQKYEERQPASMQLESLAEEEEPPLPPVKKRGTRYQTPDTSIEMALTEASVILAKEKALDTNTPDSSIISGTSVLQKNKFLVSPSPRSVSPHSPASPIEQSVEEEETAKQPTQEDLAKAYSVLYSPKISQGAPGNAYQPVRNPLSLEHPEEATDWIKVNGEKKPHVHFATTPAEDSKEKDSLLAGYIMVNGNEYSQFQKWTIDKLEQAILSTSDEDEGYAAWLQWREMMKAKKRKEEIKKLLQISDNHRDSPEPEKLAPKPTTSQLPPPKPPTVRHGAQGARRKIMSRQRQYLRQHSSGGSMNMMKSLVNPHVGVYTSILGSSVAPFLARQEKGARILCLDGGGIKGLIQIEILKYIENRTGKRITELFDWIVGTSTGGVVALGLVYARRTLDDLKKMYFELKDRVFKKQSKLIPTACDTDALEELLKETMGEDMKMSSIRKPKVLITAVDKKTTDLPLHFFNNCFNDDYSYQPVWKVARYTSAAPLHFRELDDYVDGGVVANNPCQYGLARIQEYLRTHGSDGLNVPKRAKSKVACVLSIGCGVFPPEPIGNTDILEAMKIHKLHNAPQKLSQLVTMLTSTLGKSEDVAMLCQNHCEEQEIPFFRFSPRLGEMVGTAETDNEKLCDLIIGAKHLLVESEDHLSKLFDHLGVDV